MNALFYGIALNQDKNAIVRFLSLAGIDDTDTYKDFDLYMEFSLSEYGDPDLLIIGTESNGTKTVFFVEAKVSSCSTYDVNEQMRKHDDYIDGNDTYIDGHSSNLFFQLRLKECFFKRLKEGYFGGKTDPCSGYPSRLRQSKNRERKIGDNPIVQKIVKEIKSCDKAEYIAVIPAQKNYPANNYKMNIRYVTWEVIETTFSDYVKDSFDCNKDTNGRSQILNN